MSLIISPIINNNDITTVSYVVFNSVDYSYVKHICFSNNSDSSFINSIKMHGIKINGNFIDKISEIICDMYPVISDFIESHWENNFILVIINNIVIYPCMNKDEFNLDTSAEIIDYMQSISIVYKDKFSTDLVFPNQFYEDSWRKRIDAKFAKNITIQIRDLITNFKNLYSLKIGKYNVEYNAENNAEYNTEKNKDILNELITYFNTNIRKITNEIRYLFQSKDQSNTELNIFIDKFINYVKHIVQHENKDLKEINENILLNKEIQKQNIINLNNKLFFQKIIELSM
jgi:hypothetical protein